MTIGGDKIFEKWYADKMSKKTFQKIVRLDPTSVVKKKIFKPGKYFKWLMVQYFKENFEKLYYPGIIVTDKMFKLPQEARNEIFNALHVFHQWYKRTHPQSADINKYSDISDLIRDMRHANNDFETHKKFKDKNGKVHVIYDDENVTVLEPLDFAACYRYSKHAEWCSKSENAYNSWCANNILLRFVDKKNNIIHRLTWNYVTISEWSWATPIYPEFGTHSFVENNSRELEPFDFEKFNKEAKKLEYYKNDDYEKTNHRYQQLMSLFSFLNKKCVDDIYKYYHQRKAEFSERIENQRRIAAELNAIQESRIAEWEYSGMLMYQ